MFSHSIILESSSLIIIKVCVSTLLFMVLDKVQKYVNWNIICIHFIYDSIYQFKRCLFSRMFRSKAILVRKEKTIFLKIR